MTCQRLMHAIKKRWLAPRMQAMHVPYGGGKTRASIVGERAGPCSRQPDLLNLQQALSYLRRYISPHTINPSRTHTAGRVRTRERHASSPPLTPQNPPYAVLVQLHHLRPNIMYFLFTGDTPPALPKNPETSLYTVVVQPRYEGQKCISLARHKVYVCPTTLVMRSASAKRERKARRSSARATR